MAIADKGRGWVRTLDRWKHLRWRKDDQKRLVRKDSKKQIKQETNLTDKIQAYHEIVSVMEKHQHLLDCSLNLIQSYKRAIEVMSLSDRFGIPLKTTAGSKNHITVSAFESVAIYGKAYSRTIRCSDDGSQPENEYLYVISFPSRWYIYGNDYPTESFNSMFSELKGMGAKYTDQTNSVLYFGDDVAGSVHQNFKPILKKWWAAASDEVREKADEATGRAGQVAT